MQTINQKLDASNIQRSSMPSVSILTRQISNKSPQKSRTSSLNSSFDFLPKENSIHDQNIPLKRNLNQTLHRDLPLSTTTLTKMEEEEKIPSATKAPKSQKSQTSELELVRQKLRGQLQSLENKFPLRSLNRAPNTVQPSVIGSKSSLHYKQASKESLLLSNANSTPNRQI